MSSTPSLPLKPFMLRSSAENHRPPQTLPLPMPNPIVFRFHLTGHFCIFFLHCWLFSPLVILLPLCLHATLSDYSWFSLNIPSVSFAVPKTLLLPYCSAHSKPSPLVILITLLLQDTSYLFIASRSGSLAWPPHWASNRRASFDVPPLSQAQRVPASLIIDS